jgi:hypothetical protein
MQLAKDFVSDGLEIPDIQVLLKSDLNVTAIRNLSVRQSFVYLWLSGSP